VDFQFLSVTFVNSPNPEKPEFGIPKSVTVKIPKHCSVEGLKDALEKETACPANEMLVAEVWKNKILQEYHNDSRCNFGVSDDIWVWHLPGRTPKEGKERVNADVQIVHHVMLDPRHYRVAGFPTVATWPVKKLGALPITEFRAWMKAALAPYLEGGKFKDDENDAELYQIEVMDGRVSETRGEIELKDSGEINIWDFTKEVGRSFAIGVFWKKEKLDRLKQDFGAKQKGGHSEKPREAIKLDDCIDSFVTEETLPKSEAWYCRQCKDHKCAFKKFDLYMLPDVLIIHLKRFSYDRHWREKIDSYVDFPTENLDMSKWVVCDAEKKDATYNLYAVSNHYGGLGGGHYTAFAKNLLDDKWYNLDDSSVTPVDKESVKTSAAYVLFYTRSKKKNKTYKPEDFVKPPTTSDKEKEKPSS